VKSIPIAELSPEWAALLEAARRARLSAYAPYSKYRVGAAVRTRSGAVHAGSNVENVVNRLSACAEQVAIYGAVAHGDPELQALAVVSENGATPCGACRQVMAEFATDLPILVADEAGHAWLTSLSELLPFSFSKEYLDSSSAE